MNKEIREQLVIILKPKLERLGISEKELTAGFDLVKSGFVNSLEFVELVTRLEKHFQVEVDFDRALESKGFTTFGGLVDILEKQIHG
jgi:acyl carrier protein